MIDPEAMETFVLDSGALIALEKASPMMTSLLTRVRSGHVRLIVPDAVVAQVWRGGHGRQARVAALVNIGLPRCLAVPLDTPAAKSIGVAIAESGHPDVVDAHVALLASRHHAAVITSDRDDILAVKSDLRDVIVDV